MKCVTTSWTYSTNDKLRWDKVRLNIISGTIAKIIPRAAVPSAQNISPHCAHVLIVGEEYGNGALKGSRHAAGFPKLRDYLA